MLAKTISTMAAPCSGGQNQQSCAQTCYLLYSCTQSVKIQACIASPPVLPCPATPPPVAEGRVPPRGRSDSWRVVEVPNQAKALPVPFVGRCGERLGVYELVFSTWLESSGLIFFPYLAHKATTVARRMIRQATAHVSAARPAPKRAAMRQTEKSSNQHPSNNSPLAFLAGALPQSVLRDSVRLPPSNWVGVEAVLLPERRAWRVGTRYWPRKP